MGMPLVHAVTAECSQKMAKWEYPPKFAIANGFVIGSFPQKNEFYSKDGNKQVRTIKDNDLTDLVKAILAPI